MNIDFYACLKENSPPTPEMLEAERKWMERRRRIGSWAFSLGMLVLLGLIAWLYVGDIAEEWVVGMTIAGAIVVAVVVAGIMDGSESRSGSVAGSGALAGAALGAVAGVGAGVGAVAGVAAGLVITGIFHLFDWRDVRDKTKRALTELSPPSHPDECVALDKWRGQDETIDAYTRAIASQGRKPVFGEYSAIRDWIDS